MARQTRPWPPTEWKEVLSAKYFRIESNSVRVHPESSLSAFTRWAKRRRGGRVHPPVSPLSLLPAANRVRPHRVPALLLLRAGPVDAVEAGVAQGREAGHEQRRRLRRLVLGALLHLRQGVVLGRPTALQAGPSIPVRAPLEMI